MRIKFDKLDYQDEAIESIVKVFEGQEIAKSDFTISVAREQVGMYETDLGVGNRLDINEDEIFENINKVQLKNRLIKTRDKNKALNLSVEMETGTGKTYVYSKTIFELNKEYGFTKFIIVVPSLAIKEGVNKSFQITKERFKEDYKNTIYNQFIYDSQNLERVRNFASSSNIEVMIINIDAFRKSFVDINKESTANVIHRRNDKLGGYKPIEFIQQTNPIVIIDEPQSVDSTAKAKEAIGSLNPLAILRYSATHKEKLNLVYKLDSIDAYERELVKQIEVLSVVSKNSNNNSYVKLEGVTSGKAGISAKIEVDVLDKGKIKRKSVKVKKSDDLEDITGREIYKGFIIEEINATKGNEYITFSMHDIILKKKETYGDVDHDAIKRIQIRKTIEEHLNKELRLTKEGIKVLSLFFIDKVSNYRDYDKDGNPVKGKYTIMFEEEYEKLIKEPKYNTLFHDVDIDSLKEEVHDGYFACDKKKDSKGNKLFKETKGDEGKSQADNDAYALIMREKEKLLSFNTKLKFIFSHSALREGWDNPNVFQICTLNETKSEVKKRQEIGRGLRLCVNQDGKRIHGHDINTLTVVANESYEDFVGKLQAEIEDEEGIKFGNIDKLTFATIVYKNEENKEEQFTVKESEEIYNFFKDRKLIDKHGNIQEVLKADIKFKRVKLPEKFIPFEEAITSKLAKLVGNLKYVKDVNNRRQITLKKEVILDKDFLEIWNKIKYKTTYSVNFDIDKFKEKCLKIIEEDLHINAVQAEVVKAKTKIDISGVSAKKTRREYIDIDESVQLPDILTYLQNETNLKRKTIADILIKSKRLDDFKKNPSKFMQEMARIMKETLSDSIVDGIKYERIGNEEYPVQEVFKKEELYGYLKEDIIEAKRSVYDYVKYDSDIEKTFAEELEDDERVKLYVKLPLAFKIDTPIGKYNPDWAILMEVNGEERLYFVVETKGTNRMSDLPKKQADKIRCGKKHFKALETEISLKLAKEMKDLEESIVYT